ncbi:cysteine peptidase C11 family protein [Mangrovibacterium diazotrophicum]|uniref:Cysteine peptidase C11 family protein n=2 Tax=Mangrovibacterium diazotrophicum TaxID=1261403 RepID=A0A419VXH6_9BACT|nr:cysteine peptidase C11 family protein [Mangrovibacterium diazotrophicum]
MFETENFKTDIMKQSNFIVPCLLAAVLLFASCQENEVSEEVEDTTPTRTVLAYMVADNSLNSYAVMDLEEMEEGYASVDDPEHSNLLVYLDDYSTPRLLQITQEKGVVVVDTIETYTEVNSLSVDNMKSIISDALEQFEADSYGLVLWSHGDGWLPTTAETEAVTRAFGEDLGNNSNSQNSDQMSIADLKDALKGIANFEYILFDACEMQGVEVAYELKDCANYIVASPNEVSAYGGAYDDIVPAMFTESDAALAVAQAYYAQYAENYSYDASSTGGPNNRSSGTTEGYGRYTGGTSGSSSYTYGVAVSVVDCSALDALATATKSILNSYITDGDSVATSSVYNYDDNFYNFYYDLDGFIASLTGGGDDYTSWKTYYDAAVPLFLTTEYTYSSLANDGDGGMTSMADATGLSTYIPANENFFDAVYWSYYLQYPQYTSVIEAYYEYFNSYYQSFDWYSAAGWDVSGW